MRLLLLCLGLAALPAPLLAQSGPVTVAAGFGITGSGHLSGDAYHAQLGLPLARPHETLSLRGELLAQQGTMTGSPFACERVASLHCLGRSDSGWLVGAGTHLRMDFPSARGSVRPYLTPIGIGVYHRRGESTESQGPTGICVVDGEATACASNPPFASLSERISATAPGVSTGGGVEVELLGVRAFAEARLHRLLGARGGRTGTLPLSIGFSF